MHSFSSLTTGYSPNEPIVLLPSAYGEPLYRTLGFVDLDSTSFSVYIRDNSSLPLTSSALRPVLVSTKQHQRAIAFYEACTNAGRSEVLTTIYEKYKKCVIIEEDDKVIAAAWARHTAHYHVPDKQGLFIGPVVARSGDYAIAAISHLLNLHDQSFKESNLGPASGSIALTSTIRGDTSSSSVFEALGFSKIHEGPVMILHPDSGPNEEKPIDIQISTNQYMALIYWDSG